jgi:hypothetical protein
MARFDRENDADWASWWSRLSLGLLGYHDWLAVTGTWFFNFPYIGNNHPN